MVVLMQAMTIAAVVMVVVVGVQLPRGGVILVEGVVASNEYLKGWQVLAAAAAAEAAAAAAEAAAAAGAAAAAAAAAAVHQQ